VDQRWSKGGLTDAIKEEWEEILGGGDAPCRTITTTTQEQSLASDGAATSEPEVALWLPATPEKFEEGVGGSPPAEFPGIHTTKAGWWVIDGDRFIGRWVEDEGRLDHDQWLLERILPLVKEGDGVIEVGAYIGDHTHAFLEKGCHVIAFEANPTAAECLRRNCPEADVREGALWSERTQLGLQVPASNPGAAHLLEEFKNGDVVGFALDSLIVPNGARADPDIRIDLVVIDVEGTEVFVLRGAKKTIAEFHPVLIIEINRGALARYGFRAQDIFEWLKENGYEWETIQPLLVPDPPQYDVVCNYIRKSKDDETPVAEGEPWSDKDKTLSRIAAISEELAGYCTAPRYTGIVRRALVGTGVFPVKVLKKL
jgi:FkbM family methyltransferase